MLGDFIHTLHVLHAIFRMRTGRYIGVPTSRVSVLKLERVFALFSRPTQYRLAKSIANNIML